MYHHHYGAINNIAFNIKIVSSLGFSYQRKKTIKEKT